MNGGGAKKTVPGAKSIGSQPSDCGPSQIFSHALKTCINLRGSTPNTGSVPIKHDCPNKQVYSQVAKVCVDTSILTKPTSGSNCADGRFDSVRPAALCFVSSAPLTLVRGPGPQPLRARQQRPQGHSEPRRVHPRPRSLGVDVQQED